MIRDAEGARRGEPTPTSADLARAARAERKTNARALVCGGATCSGKAFGSQWAPEGPIGATSRKKVLKYQQTAKSVLNRGGGAADPPPVLSPTIAHTIRSPTIASNLLPTRERVMAEQPPAAPLL